MIWSLADEGRASHWSDGPPAAHLEEANRADDLELGRRGEGIPLVRRAAGRRDVTEGDGGDVRVHRADRGLERPREVDAVGLEAVADEASHGDTAVLDLGVAEPADVLRRGLADAERVPVADDRVELDRELLEASGILDLARRPRLVREVRRDALGDGLDGGRARDDRGLEGERVDRESESHCL